MREREENNMDHNKFSIKRLITICFCLAMFATMAASTEIKANAETEMTEEIVSFAEDRIIYNSMTCKEIVGTLPAGQSISATKITMPSGKVKYLFDRGNGEAGFVWADKTKESADAVVVKETSKSNTSKKNTAKTTSNAVTYEQFDAKYYAANNPDVKKTVGTSKKKLYDHYVQYGQYEGRLPFEGYVEGEGSAVASSKESASNNKSTGNTVTYEQFDAKYYAANNPDVKKAVGSSKKKLYDHYMQYGQYEGRLPYAGYVAGEGSTEEVKVGYSTRETVEAVLAKVNAERAAAGVPELVWDEGAYEIAKQRCVENDIHESARENTGENCLQTFTWNREDPDAIHQIWYESQGHRENYMNQIYTRGAVAVYVNESGECVAYEVFLPYWY